MHFLTNQCNLDAGEAPICACEGSMGKSKNRIVLTGREGALSLGARDVVRCCGAREGGTMVVLREELGGQSLWVEEDLLSVAGHFPYLTLVGGGWA